MTQQHVGEGSYVAAGATVITLTMMNPIRIQITVSGAEDERLAVGTDTIVYPMKGNEIDDDRQLHATLFEKQGVADTSTRTFNLGLISSNRHRTAHTELADIPTVPFVFPLFENPLDLANTRGLYTMAEAVGNADGTSFVMKVRDLTQGERSEDSLNRRLQADRVEVTVSNRTIQVGSFTLVELLDAKGMGAGDLLVPEPASIHESGFVIDDKRWLLRPGDLVQVALGSNALPVGFYVPIQAIREVNGGTKVFVVDESDRVRAVDVEVKESTGELRRVVSSALSSGDAVVKKGAHFLQDGDTVIRGGSDAGANQ